MPEVSAETIERAKRYLLASEEEMAAAGLAVHMRARLLRLRESYAFWLQNPRMPETEMVEVVRRKHKIGITQAYEDLKIVKICLGNLSRLTRDYDRYLFRQRCEEGWEMARAQGDARAFAAVTAAYGKYTQLDKESENLPDYSAITPQTFAPVADPSVDGFKTSPGILERAKKLEARYARETELQAAEVEEVTPADPAANP